MDVATFSRFKRKDRKERKEKERNTLCLNLSAMNIAGALVICLCPHVFVDLILSSSPLKILLGKLELSTTINNNIISKPRGPYLPLS